MDAVRWIGVRKGILSALVGLLAAAAPLAETKLPFEEMSRGFRTENGLDQAGVGVEVFDQLLQNGRYVSLDLGTFQLWYPAGMNAPMSRM